MCFFFGGASCIPIKSLTVNFWDWGNGGEPDILIKMFLSAVDKPGFQRMSLLLEEFRQQLQHVSGLNPPKTI